MKIFTKIILGPSPKIQKRSFTLLEMMLSITLLLAAAGFLSFKAFDTLSFYRYRHCVRKCYEELLLAERTALSSGHVIIVSLHPSNKGLLIEKHFSGTKKSKNTATKKFDVALTPVLLGPLSLEGKKSFSITFSEKGRKRGAEEILIIPQKTGKGKKHYKISLTPSLSIEELS